MSWLSRCSLHAADSATATVATRRRSSLIHVRTRSIDRFRQAPVLHSRGLTTRYVCSCTGTATSKSGECDPELNLDELLHTLALLETYVSVACYCCVRMPTWSEALIIDLGVVVYMQRMHSLSATRSRSTSLYRSGRSALRTHSASAMQHTCESVAWCKHLQQSRCCGSGLKSTRAVRC